MDLPDKKFWAACDCGIGNPVPLAKADLSRPFIYDRAYGVFLCQHGHHQVAMSLLLAWHHDCDHGIDVGQKLGLSFSDGTADYYVEHTPGVCFKSSVGSNPEAWQRGSLNAMELRIIEAAAGSVRYIGISNDMLKQMKEG